MCESSPESLAPSCHVRKTNEACVGHREPHRVSLVCVSSPPTHPKQITLNPLPWIQSGLVRPWLEHPTRSELWICIPTDYLFPSVDPLDPAPPSQILLSQCKLSSQDSPSSLAPFRSKNLSSDPDLWVHPWIPPLDLNFVVPGVIAEVNMRKRWL